MSLFLAVDVLWFTQKKIYEFATPKKVYEFATSK